MRTTMLIALALLAMSRQATSAPIAVKRREQIENPPQGKIPKQKAQFGKPPRKLHNRGIGNGAGRKNR